MSKVTVIFLGLVLCFLGAIFAGGQGTTTVVGLGGGLPSGFGAAGSGNAILGPNGSVSAPTYSFTNQTGTGMYVQTPGSDLDFAMAGARIGVLGPNYWAVLSNTAQFSMGTGLDTSFSRVGVASATFGGGSLGDSTGTFKTAGYLSGGTTFTASGCGNTTLIGGATAGSYVSVTGGACTVTITMGNTVTAGHGFACDAHDVTTVADANNITLGTTTTTTANLVEGTVAANDVIVFKCEGY